MTQKLELLGLGQADKESLQEKVYAKLRNAIMSGALKPGQPASIRGLAAAMGTSPIPVREALQRLSTERALEALPNGSVAVPLMTRERFLDLRRTRRLVEGFATELAADRLTGTDLKSLDRAIAQMARHRARDNMKELLVANYELRFTIYRGAGSATLLPIIESLWLQVGPWFNLALSPSAAQVTVDLQQEAVEALKRRDGAAARQLVERDLDETAEHVLSYLDGLGEPDRRKPARSTRAEAASRLGPVDAD